MVRLGYIKFWKCYLFSMAYFPTQKCDFFLSTNAIILYRVTMYVLDSWPYFYSYYTASKKQKVNYSEAEIIALIYGELQ